MPVVNEDWRDPAGWAKARVCWGLVRDGDAVRLSRCAGRSAEAEAVLPVAAFAAGEGAAGRLRAEVRRGARLVAGLDPSRVVLRDLRSPLRDAAKAEEVWPALLDAALPYPLEGCVVAFAGSRPAEGSGLRCAAYAAREEDVRAEVAAWEGLGVSPDLLVPEAAVLLAAGGEGLGIWRGTARMVFVWGGGTEGGSGLQCGGAKADVPVPPGLKRFCLALGVEADAAEAVAALSGRLAELGLQGGAGLVNLRGGDLASAGLRGRHARAGRAAAVAGVALVLAGVALPWGLAGRLTAEQGALRREMAEVYREVTGMPSPAPGQERLLLERWLTEARGEEAAVLARMEGARAADRLGDLLRLAQLTGMQVMGVEVAAAGWELRAAGPAVAAEALGGRLRALGGGSPSRVGDEEIWVFRGEGGR